MAVCAICAFHDVSPLRGKSPDAGVFFAELRVARVAGRADFVFFFATRRRRGAFFRGCGFF
jgi:hypothetical protein